MDTETHRKELRARLLQARTVKERLQVLADVRRFLRTLPPSETRTLTLQLLCFGYADPVGNWRAVLTYAAQAAAEPYQNECTRTYTPMMRGGALVRLGRFEQALSYLEQGEAAPDNACTARAWRIGALLRLGRAAEARELLTAFPVLQNAWDEANLWDAIAHVMEAEGNFAGASAAGNRAVRLYSDMGPAASATTLLLLYRLVVRCAERLGDTRARRLAIQCAAAHALNIQHADRARRMLTPGERGGEYTNAAAEGLDRLGARHRRVGGDGPDGCSVRRPHASVLNSQRAA